MKMKVIEDVLEDGTITQRFERVDRQRKRDTPEDFHSPKVDAARAKRERRRLRNIRREWKKIVTSGTRENPGCVILVPRN